MNPLTRLWARLIPAGTPVLVDPVDEPVTKLVDQLHDVPELWTLHDNAFRSDGPKPPPLPRTRPHITDQADDYEGDPRILSRGPLVVVLADGRALCRPSQSHTWRLYRNNRPLGGYWHRLDTALGHLLGHPQTPHNPTLTAMAALTPDNPDLPAEEAHDA